MPELTYKLTYDHNTVFVLTYYNKQFIDFSVPYSGKEDRERAFDEARKTLSSRTGLDEDDLISDQTTK